MARSKRFLSLFVPALVAVPLLPLYIVRTLMRSYTESGGDEISYGWEIVDLPTYVGQMSFAIAEQRPVLWLVVNLALAVVYAALLALAGTRIWDRLRPQ